MKKGKNFLSILLIGVILISVSACTGKKEKKVVIASKPMTEQFIIAEMLIALIEENTDIKVEHKAGIGGGTSNIHPMIEKGEIDMYPEYTGTGWMFVLKNEPMRDAKELYDKVKKEYKEKYNIVWSGMYGFNNTYGIALKEKLAKDLNIKTYSDLAKHSEELVFGSNPDFFEREDGFIGVSNEYGFKFKDTVEMDIGLKYEAIESGQVQVTNVFSTDSKLEKYEMVALEDDKNYFPSYYAATLIRQETLDKYPELEEVLAKLDNQINNEEMTKLNYQVEIEKKEAKEVALNYLKEKSLLK